MVNENFLAKSSIYFEKDGDKKKLEFKKILIVAIILIEIVVSARAITIQNNINLGLDPRLQRNVPILMAEANVTEVFTIKTDGSMRIPEIDINIGSKNGKDMILLKVNESNNVQGNPPFSIKLCPNSNEETFSVTCLNSDNSVCNLSVSVKALTSSSFCTQTGTTRSLIKTH
ncbi:hypothetical protein ACTFIZ_006120 [Dictyostelium cf. discoideum]